MFFICSTRPMFICLLCGAFVWAVCGRNAADDPKQSAQESSIKQDIHQLTESARTAKDFSLIVEKCQTSLDGQLSDGDRAYLKSLKSWALNRRCEKRMELAADFGTAGNQPQMLAVKDQALADAIEAIELDATRWRAFLNRGILFSDAGLPEQSLADFQMVCQLKPDEPMGWFNCGEIQSALGNDRDAINSYDHALQIDSSDLQALTGRGLARCKLNDFEGALQDFEMVAKINSNNPAALVNRGDARVGMCHWQEAKQDFERALNHDQTGIAAQRVAWLLATCPDESVRQSTQALAMAKQSIAQAGETADNLEALAAAHAANGDFESAVQAQNSAIERSAKADPSRSDRLTMYQAKTPFVQQVHRIEAAMRTSTPLESTAPSAK